jgi:phosphotransferase system HPr (HPr) family protein
MRTQELTLQNQHGLHARPCSELVQLTTVFTCKIRVDLNGKETNAKSVIGLMTLGAKKGDTIHVITDGPDEQEAMDRLKDFFINLKE